MTCQVSGCRKGLGIASIESAGQTSTTEVPRHTTRPRERVSSVILKWSFGSENGEKQMIARVQE